MESELAKARLQVNNGTGRYEKILSLGKLSAIPVLRDTTFCLDNCQCRNMGLSRVAYT
jgi:hypothetical protein